MIAVSSVGRLMLIVVCRGQTAVSDAVKIVVACAASRMAQ